RPRGADGADSVVAAGRGLQIESRPDGWRTSAHRRVDRRVGRMTTSRGQHEFTILLPDCASAEALVGGKAVGLAKLHGAGFPVPAGFAVTTAAYSESVTNSELGARIRQVLDDSSITFETMSQRIHALFSKAVISPEVARAVANSYE